MLAERQQMNDGEHERTRARRHCPQDGQKLVETLHHGPAKFDSVEYTGRSAIRKCPLHSPQLAKDEATLRECNAVQEAILELGNWPTGIRLIADPPQQSTCTSGRMLLGWFACSNLGIQPEWKGGSTYPHVHHHAVHTDAL